ncbi:MAG: DUF4956 domain-containing protein [Oscillospiraceae bacterium]|nr:DUF4956 domain-containing protein [Bacteroidales bacterium]MDD6998173.1 DUF4956 domain-containing protein [Oscillospiraceae bacterium]MDY5095591.1 DUF4956 domain-containing protein [Oscillospiraceae bacterium]
MSIKDAIKKSVLQEFTDPAVTMGDIAAALGMAAVLALYIYLIYKLVTRSAFYSRDFNKSLAMLPVITAGILLAMQSSFVISLGSVGALSIVRFRNAVKDPMDLVFLFWSISIGIVCGAKLYALAILLSLVLTVLVFVLDLIPAAKSPMLLVMNGSDASVEAALQPILKQQAKAAHVKSRNLTTAGIDLIVELRPNDPPALVQACAALPGVQSVSLLDHDGQIRY